MQGDIGQATKWISLSMFGSTVVVMTGMFAIVHGERLIGHKPEPANCPPYPPVACQSTPMPGAVTPTGYAHPMPEPGPLPTVMPASAAPPAN